MEGGENSGSRPGGDEGAGGACAGYEGGNCAPARQGHFRGDGESCSWLRLAVLSPPRCAFAALRCGARRVLAEPRPSWCYCCRSPPFIIFNRLLSWCCRCRSPHFIIFHRLLSWCCCCGATCGVLQVCSKRPASHVKLMRQFAARRTKRVYLALVAGVPSPRDGQIDRPL